MPPPLPPKPCLATGYGVGGVIEKSGINEGDSAVVEDAAAVAAAGCIAAKGGVDDGDRAVVGDAASFAADEVAIDVGGVVERGAVDDGEPPVVVNTPTAGGGIAGENGVGDGDRAGVVDASKP